MPRRLVALGRRLAEHVATPKDDVVAQHAAHQLDDLGVAREIEKGAAAAHAFSVVALDVGGDELFGADGGVVVDEGVEGGGHC